jgi:hypothetical protein
MRAAVLLLLFSCLFAFTLPAAPVTAAYTCEGDACSQVSMTFDEQRQQYHAHNNSSERWARVTASNLAATTTACLGPGGDAYLTLKSMEGAYRADFTEARCGEEGPEGAPPASE